MENIYRYNIKLEYEIDGVLLSIETNRIHSLIIDYDYDLKNMPILYAKISLDKKILDDMKKNIGKKTIKLTINKFIDNIKPVIEREYIKDEFIYFMDNNINTSEDLDYNNETKGKNEYHTMVTIGLAKLDLINNNKILINDIFKNTSIINILCKNLSHMKLLIEPLVNNKIIDNMVIPPLDTVTKFIDFVNSQYSLYNTKYRLFYDFDKTYILSSEGNKVESVDELYSTVILNVENTISRKSKIQGIEIDNERNAYLIHLDATDINIAKNMYASTSYNNIVGINGNGETKEIKLNSDEKINRTKIERFRNNNLDKLNHIKNEIDNNLVITITKNDIDTSVITINKEYYIRNYNKLKNNDGKYILLRKREIYLRSENNFVLTNILSFKQIKS